MGGGQSSSRKEFTFDILCENLEKGAYKNIIVMCGAGISTNVGIPDFRSPSAGLYMRLKKFNLPSPEAIFEGSYFRQNPEPFYGLVREIYPRELRPSDTHRFFTLLHRKNLLLRVYTQNIDALEFLGGLPEDKVVEAHGSFQRSYCTKCSEKYDLEWLKNAIFNSQRDRVPKCPKCGGVVRPDVVFFGESLPQRYWDLIADDFPKCDLLMVFGTSLVVAPFNTLITRVRAQVPRVYINRSKPGSVGVLGWFMGMRSSVKFEKATDLVLLQDCDEAIHGICNKNSWSNSLKEIPIKVMKA